MNADGKHVTGYEYRFVNDLGGWSAWQPISRADYERELVEPVKDREVRPVVKNASLKDGAFLRNIPVTTHRKPTDP